MNSDSVHISISEIILGLFWLLVAIVGFMATFGLFGRREVQLIAGPILFVGSCNILAIGRLTYEIRRLRWEQANRPATGA